MNIFFVSLGCDKNLVDSEYMLGILQSAGYSFTNTEEDADVIVINTCTFIDSAKEESINTILEMAQWKERGRCKALIATGCLAQRFSKEIKEELPEVDAIIGTNSWDEIAKAVTKVLEQKHFEKIGELTGMPDMSKKRILTSGTHYAYLKIAEGCDKHCTYCVIPSIRGKYRSVSMEVLIKQAQDLVEMGVKELLLVAQETTLYGVDLYEKKSLHILLQKLAKIDELKWIRILYCYPEEIYPELVEEIKNNPKVCHYLDLPIQHCSDRILKKMARRTSKAELKKTFEMLRREIPDIALRTTVICGFPGETKEEHKELLSFIEEIGFDRLGAFAYSREEGTAAASFENQIEDETKQLWVDEVMELQQEICEEKCCEMIGTHLKVLVEGTAENVYVCRTYRDAPDIDGYLFLETSQILHTGDFVNVKVTGAYEYDLIGELE
ncbi:30S ribosomal protein S12 methylthiotransferase RimO [Eubacterium oxidoreducens]|nr:30S ribosomal protein S12 methylthiotransferase RimO [Eubacterium oxidoreducens]